jgi:outer membrane protein
LGVSINIPVFNKGITKLQIEQSKLNWQLANNAYSMAQLQVKQTIQKYYFDVLSASKNLQSALSSEKATQISLDYAERSYLVGRISIYELNLARNNQSNALGSLAQAKFNLIFSYKLLYFYTYLHQNSTI